MEHRVYSEDHTAQVGLCGSEESLRKVRVQDSLWLKKLVSNCLQNLSNYSVLKVFPENFKDIRVRDTLPPPFPPMKSYSRD